MSMTANPSPGRQRLDSWKEVAAFFGRDERTVNRWEKERGLPVHRVPGTKGRIFAYTDELTDWLEGGGPDLPRLAGANLAESDANQKAPAETSEPENIPAPEAGTAYARPNLSIARMAAWLVPLVFAGGLVVLFSFGNRGLHFKALANRHAPNAEAQDLYLKGRYYWDRRTPDDLNKAVDYFTQAIVKDPSDAEAYVGLADCYNLLREFGAMAPSEAYPRALSAAQRAVELDDASAEAHNSLAFVTFWWSWQGATAEREFKRALELNPNFVRGHHWYATYLLCLHRYQEALDQIEQAQRLEPSSTAILADKGMLLWRDGRPREGLALLKQLATTEPSLSSTHAYLGQIFWEQKDYTHALMERRRLAELRHDDAGLAIADAAEKGFAAGGLRGLWEGELPLQKALVDRGSGSAFDVALTEASLGRTQEALAYLQIAFDRREAGLLANDPVFPTLQDEPAFQALMAKVKDSLAQ